ncbi:MAG: ATPase [Sphingomonadaceae bacterium]|nr:ATPase [Sphingomonadaceae bacterium]
MPQFEVANALPQIVWLALIFAILYLTLSYGALPKVDKMATKRAQVIGDDLAHAESAKAQAEATSAAYEASLAEARNNAAKVTVEAKATTSRDTAERLKGVDTDLNARIAEAAARIDTARTQALANLDAVAADATADIVERLTGRRPSASEAGAAIAAAQA